MPLLTPPAAPAALEPDAIADRFSEGFPAAVTEAVIQAVQDTLTQELGERQLTRSPRFLHAVAQRLTAQSPTLIWVNSEEALSAGQVIDLRTLSN